MPKSSHLEVDATPDVGVSFPQTRMRMCLSELSGKNFVRVRDTRGRILSDHAVQDNVLHKSHSFVEKHYEQSQSIPAFNRFFGGLY